jgi:hypothetical protein
MISPEELEKWFEATESQVKKEVKRRLLDCGWMIVDTASRREMHVKVSDQDERTEEVDTIEGGVTDLICIRFNHVVWAEIKAPGKDLRDIQRSFFAKLSRHLGANVHHCVIDLPHKIPPWMMKWPK